MPNGRNRLQWFLFGFAVLVWSLRPLPAQAQEIPPQDVVFLVDSSESAAALLPLLSGVVSRFAAESAAGDSFTCYQFSNSPLLVAKGKIRRQSDIKTLQEQLLNFRELGKYTNYTSALQKGLADIADSRVKYPAHERLLVLITDGRGADDMWTEKLSLEDLLRTYSEIQVGRDYFFTCFYIGDEAEDDLRSFLYSARARLVYWPKDKRWLQQLTLGEVCVMEQKKNLGAIPEEPASSSFSLSFYPRRRPPLFTMIELDLDEDFTQQTLDRLFDVRPRRFAFREKPWEETFALETRGFAQGNYAGRFLFRPSDPQIVLVHPYAIPFSFSVAESLSVVVPQPLTFGPTGLKGKFEETKTVYIRPGQGSVPEDFTSIKAMADISLPEGLHLELSPVLKQRELIIYVTLSRAEGSPKLSKGEYDGVIRLKPPAGLTLSERSLPLSVNVRKKPINFRPFLLYAGIGVGVIVAVVLILFSFSGIRREVDDYMNHRSRPSGKLTVLKDPTKELAKTFDLAKISQRREGKEVWVGGTGEAVDVEIPHISMVDKMFRFTGLHSGGGIETFVEVIQGADSVLVNDIPRVGRIPLKHLDRIKMGALEFRYEEPLLLQQVVLYYLSGEVRQGWLLDWNTAGEGFRLLNRDNGSQPEETSVQFSELKAVAFLRDFDGDLTKNLLSLKVPRQGHLVKIIFADQEELTGYVLDWKNPGDKFYLFPNEMGQNIMFFLLERHTLKEMRLLREDEHGARVAAIKFKRIQERMSWGQRTSSRKGAPDVA